MITENNSEVLSSEAQFEKAKEDAQAVVTSCRVSEVPKAFVQLGTTRAVTQSNESLEELLDSLGEALAMCPCNLTLPLPVSPHED